MDVLNYVYEKVSLEEIGKNRQICTVNGKIATAKETSFAVTHLTTFV